MGFAPATPDTSGVTRGHLPSIHGVCKNKNAFLFVRPSTAATMRLIDAGFATKSMDIHDKSSDWGLTSGFVPIDQAFSKKKIGQPNPLIHPHGHGDAQPVHLSFTDSQISTLLSQGHFEKTTKFGESGEAITFHSSANTDVEFTWSKASKKVHWRWREKTPKTDVPMWVWGYNGIPVTGDYDMWMVVPHISEVSGQKDILSVKDSHGRSAASQFTIGLIPALNAACGRSGSPVFNHGAEAQNFSFTQELDRHLALFCPGSLTPVMVPRMVLPGVLHDLLRHGYVAILNPKWRSGSTLGIDDMGSAAAEGHSSGVVTAGTNAMKALQSNAASRIALAWKKKKGGLDAEFGEEVIKRSGEWKKRYELLRFFRAIANTPEEQHKNLILPDEAFPKGGSGSSEDTRELARKMAAEVEASFGRTGFVDDDGHVTPVDATSTPIERGSVSKLIGAWEKLSGS
ncbi:MAG: hypothetical protein ACI9HK_006270 [Pirellulaceae bacterium]|jgi:hypothetical protein